ncbi:hypothetical protein TTHERM_01099090 (macronuclear) [Tetrahymena thermophila SB210]|uniref:Uncharacterized protein n=1 Tax=Tetrahymena thermophila (strain SB210) TaxID=312017 RepID=Q22BK4_TETTS|nr:hypothetical protein TTHERM_01099090 [Tetrahymena thermophila SB210]EAR82662.2 hypothetical protein TTHERM_01099090 [Tetrahymena thermophila SB210]|eukprot:XP_001030325.2 hypothetical protein TTHERM_01099090 [Tetrahymena thermophila SB210]
MSDQKSYTSPKQLMYLTIEDYQFDNKKIQSSFECRVSINDLELDVLSLHKVSLEIPIYSYGDSLNLFFVNTKNELIGSITFPLELFSDQKIVKRWITLFDPEDDNYDGDFLEDDTEVPRVLLNFQMSQISNEYISQEQSKYVYMSNLNSLNGFEGSNNEGMNANTYNQNSSNSNFTYNIPINNKFGKSIDALQQQDENREQNTLNSSATKKNNKEIETTHFELEQLKKDFEQELQKIKQVTQDFSNERDMFLKSQKLTSANSSYELLTEKISKQINEFILQNNQQKKQNEQISSLQKEIYSLKATIATRDINIKDLEQKLKIMKQREEQLYVQIQALNVVIDDLKAQNSELKQQYSEIQEALQSSDRNSLNQTQKFKKESEKDIQDQLDQQINSFDKEVRDLQEEIQKRQQKELENESKLKEYELQFKIQDKKISQLLQIQRESDLLQKCKSNQGDSRDSHIQFEQNVLLEQIKKNYELSINNLTDIIQSKDKLISELNQQLYMSIQPENDLSASNYSQKLGNSHSGKKSEQIEFLENEILRQIQLINANEKKINELVYENNDLREKNFNLHQKLNISKSEGLTKNQLLQQKTKELEIQISELREKNYSDYHEKELINAKYEKIQFDFIQMKELLSLKELEVQKLNSLIQEIQYENSQIPSLKESIHKFEFNYQQIQAKVEEVEQDNRDYMSQNKVLEETLAQMRAQKEGLLSKYEEVQKKQQGTMLQMEELAQRTEEMLNEIQILTEEKDLLKEKYEVTIEERNLKENEYTKSVLEIKQTIIIMQQNLDNVNNILNEERQLNSQLQEEIAKLNGANSQLESQFIEESIKCKQLNEREVHYKQEIGNLQQQIAYKHQELLQLKDQITSLSDSSSEFKEEAQKKFEYMNQVIKQKQQEIEDMQNQLDDLEKQIQDLNHQSEQKLESQKIQYNQQIQELNSLNQQYILKFTQEIENLKLTEQQEKDQNDKKLNLQINSLNSQILNLQSELEESRSSNQAQIKSFKTQIELLQNKNEQITDQLGQQDLSIQMYEQKILLLQNQENELKINYQKELEELKAHLIFQKEQEMTLQKQDLTLLYQGQIDDMAKSMQQLQFDLDFTKQNLSSQIEEAQKQNALLQKQEEEISQLNSGIIKYQNQNQEYKTQLELEKQQYLEKNNQLNQQHKKQLDEIQLDHSKLLDELRNQIKFLNETYQINQQQDEDKINDLDQKVKQSNQENQEKQEQIELLNENIENYQNSLNEIISKNKEIQEQYQQLSLENQVVLANYQQSKQQVEQLQQKLDDTNNQCDKYLKLQESYEQEIANLKEFILSQGNQLKESEDIIATHIKEVENLTNIINEFEIIRQKLIESEETEAKLQNQLEISQQQQKNYKDLLEEQYLESSKLQQKIDEQQQVIKSQSSDLINLINEKKELQNHYEEKITNLNENLKSIEDEKYQEQNAIQEKDSVINQLRKELEQYNQEKESLQSEFKQQMQDLQELNINLKKQIEISTQTLHEKQTEIEEYKLRLTEKAKKIETNQQEVQENSIKLQITIAEKENAEQKIIELTKLLKEAQLKEEKLTAELLKKENLILENVDQINMINEQLVICEINLKENKQFEKECQQKDELIKQLQSQIVLLKDQIKLLEVQFNEKQSEASKHQKHSLQKDFQIQEKENDLQNLSKENQDLKQKLNLNQQEIIKLEAEIANIKNKSLSEYNEMQEEQQKLKESFQQEKQQYKVQINEIKDNAEKEKQNFKKCKENLEEQNEQLRLQVSKALTEIEELKSVNDQIFANKLREETKRFTSLMEKYYELEETNNKNLEKLQQNESLLKDMQEQEVIRSTQLSDLNQIIKEANTLNKTLAAQIEDLKKDIDENDLKQNEKIEQEKKKNRNLEVRLQDLQEQIVYLTQENEKYALSQQSQIETQKLEDLQSEKILLLQTIESSNKEKEQLMQELDYFKAELEQLQIDRKVLQEEVELLNKMTTLQLKTQENDVKSVYQEQLEEANRIKLELIQSLQDKERELSEKEAELLATKLQEQSLSKKIEDLRSSQEMLTKEQQKFQIIQAEELESKLNKYNEDKMSMIQTINDLEYTIDKLVKQNELLSSEIEKRDREYISVCQQIEDTENRLAMQSDSLFYQEKYETALKQLQEKQQEIDNINKISEEKMLTLKNQIEELKVSNKQSSEIFEAEKRNKEQERDNILLKELKMKEELLLNLKEEILQLKQNYDQEIKDSNQKNNELIQRKEQDHLMQMNHMRNDLVQQFSEQFDLLKMKSEQTELQNAEQIQSIITEKNEIIEKILKEKNEILNDLSNQKNCLYNEFTIEKSRLIQMNENLLEELSGLRQSLHKANLSEQKKLQSSGQKNKYESENDYITQQNYEAQDLHEQLLVKEKIIKLKEQEINDLIQQKNKIDEKYQENLLKNDDLINRIEEISKRNQELIYQNEELTEIFEKNQQKFQVLSEMYDLRMSEIHNLQNQLDQFASPSRLQIFSQNRDHNSKIDRQDEDDDRHTLKDRNILNNESSIIPLDTQEVCGDSTTYNYQNEIPQQESFFEKHPAALAAVQASNSARQQYLYYGLSYEDLQKKVAQLGEELNIVRQEDESKKIQITELQKQLDIMRNQQNEIEFSLMQQQHQMNLKSSARKNQNTQMSLQLNPSNQQAGTELSITNFNSTAPVQLTTNTFEVIPEQIATERKENNKQENLQQYFGGSRAIQMAQNEATIIKLQFEIEKVNSEKDQLYEEINSLRKEIEILIHQIVELESENKSLNQKLDNKIKQEELDNKLSNTFEEIKNYTPKQQKYNYQQNQTPSRGVNTSPFNRQVTPNDKKSTLSTSKKSPNSVKRQETKSGFKQEIYSIQEDHELNDLIEKHMEMIKELQLKNKQLQEENEQLKDSLGKNLDDLQMKNDEIYMKYEEKIKQYNSGYSAKYINLIKENEELNFLNKQLKAENEKITQQNAQLKEYNAQLIEKISSEQQQNVPKQISNTQSPFKSPLSKQIVPIISVNEPPEQVKVSMERPYTPEMSYNQQDFIENSPQFQRFISGLEKQYENSQNEKVNNRYQQMYFLNDNYSDAHRSDFINNSNNTSTNNINLSKSATKLPPSGQKKASASFIFTHSKQDLASEKESNVNNSYVINNQQQQNCLMSGSKSQRQDKRSSSNTNAKNSLLQLKAIASRESPFK